MIEEAKRIQVYAINGKSFAVLTTGSLLFDSIRRKVISFDVWRKEVLRWAEFYGKPIEYSSMLKESARNELVVVAEARRLIRAI